MKNRFYLFIFIFLLQVGPLDAQTLSFNREVRPILAKNCFPCHGPDEKARRGKFRLDIREDALKVLMAPDGESPFIKRISHADPSERMPPLESNLKLAPDQIGILKKWVSQGFPYEQHWAFISPQKADIPKDKNRIDFLIEKRLKDEGLDFSSEAEKHTLIRRVSLDLTGVPPSLKEVEDFLKDKSPEALEKVVDRLLASPRHGEHFAASWLEASRYADTDGYQNDRYRYHWVWRDWLIYVLNENIPYDQFVVEQIAGDMLPNATLHQQIATGFNRNHRINSEAGSIPKEWQVEYVSDRVEALGTVFLGLTLSCARCHDHKYDPISQKEFYQLFAYFNNVPEFGTGPNNGNSPPFIPVPAGYPEITKDLNKAITPAPISWQGKQQYSGGVRRPKPGDPKTVMVLHEMKKPRETYLLKRGIYNQPDKSERLQPQVPESLRLQKNVFEKNRLGLAHWLTDPQHPLTARVFVNRAWQHFMGQGLVRSSENLGFQGDYPSHPALLDDLARTFIESDWNVKALYKRIVLSRTYRQSSRASQALLQKDPDNRLLARASRLRLPPFIIRDQALHSSGLLKEKLYGPPVKPYMPPKIWRAFSNNAYKQDKGDKLYRRSLYTYWRRTIPPPTMMTFNASDREVCTVRQSRTNTPLQALTLMNNIAFVEASRFLAERMLLEGGEEPAKMIQKGYQLLLCRLPRTEEIEVLLEDYRVYLKEFQANADLAKKLLKVGEGKHTSELKPEVLAAATLIATTLFNLDEAITRE